MEAKELFARRLKELRTEKGMSLNELAEALQTTSQSLSFYERAERAASIEILAKAAKFFNVSADYLMGLSTNRNNEKNNEDITIGEIAHNAERLTGLNQNTISKLLNLNMNLKEYIAVINEFFEHDDLLIDFFVRLFELSSFSYVSLKFTENFGVQKEYRRMADENRYRLHFSLERLMNIYDYDVLYSVNIAPYAAKELNEVKKEMKNNVNDNKKDE